MEIDERLLERLQRLRHEEWLWGRLMMIAFDLTLTTHQTDRKVKDAYRTLSDLFEAVRRSRIVCENRIMNGIRQEVQ